MTATVDDEKDVRAGRMGHAHKVGGASMSNAGDAVSHPSTPPVVR